MRRIWYNVSKSLGVCSEEVELVKDERPWTLLDFTKDVIIANLIGIIWSKMQKMRLARTFIVAFLAGLSIGIVSSQGNPSNSQDSVVNALDTKSRSSVLETPDSTVNGTIDTILDNTQGGDANPVSINKDNTSANSGGGGRNSKPRGKNGKPRRRPIRRRGRRRKGARRRPPPRRNGNKPANGSTSKTLDTSKTSVNPNADPQTVPPTTKSTPPPQTAPLKQEQKVKKEKTPSNQNKKSSQDQNVFFNFFDDATTTTESSIIDPASLPDIVLDKKSIKVMPTVDTKNSKAYDGTPCNETFKPHETIKHKYMMKYAEDVWGTLDCPPNLDKGLVWRQDLCSCGEELVPHDPNDWCAQMGFNPHPTNKHQYTRRHHGAHAKMDCAANLVWSQENCLCMYDPTVPDRPIENPVTFVCKKILHLEFEGNLKNSAEAYHVQPVKLRRRGKLPRIRYVKVPGAMDRAAMIVSQPLEFLAYRGNDFQKQVTYSLNFKLSPRHLTRKNFMVLITDECQENQVAPRLRKPGIGLRFQPNTRSFRLDFRTENEEISEVIKGANPDRNGWFKTVVYFEDNSLNLETNGKLLFSMKDIKGKIPQTKCPLYIAGRGQGFDRSQDFYGYMDNVLLVKDCKFHEANIKIL